MDSGYKKNVQSKSNPNPVAKANFLSKLFFIWLLPFLRKGTQRDLTPEDMYDVLEENEARFVGDQLESEWEKEKLLSKKVGKEPQLVRCILRIHGKRYVFLTCLCIVNECAIKVLQPIFLRWLIQSFYVDSTATVSDRYFYAGGLSMTILLYSLLVHVSMHYFMCIGAKCKAALSVLVYRKALVLSKHAMRDATTGHVVNLLSTDVTRFDWNLWSQYILVGPLQLAVFGYLLWSELQFVSFAGVGMVAILLPMQIYVFKYSERIRDEVCRRTDSRASFMSEIIVAIRVIKMYAWENPMSALIHKLRRLEVKYLTKLAYLQSFYLILYYASAKLITLLLIVTYVLSGNSLTADTTFFCVAIANAMLYACLYCLPIGASDLAAILVSMKRLQKYLLLEEFKLNHELAAIDENQNQSTISEAGGQCQPRDATIVMQSVNASWTGEKMTLKNMNLNLSGNQLVMVIGSVGSGKSSFLNALISELPIKSGNFIKHGTIAYASQDPWLFSGTVKQNIVFGCDYDVARYQPVVAVAGLEPDLKQFPYGNSTIVGERGVALSGGQKARINLARCLYQEADIYLLDDPLSAVDAHVSRHIFKKCIKTHLDGKLRILVTHQLQYLPSADHIIVFKEGEIAAQGSFEELLTQNVDFIDLMSNGGDGDEQNQNRKDSTLSLTSRNELHAEDNEPEFLEEQMTGGHVTLKTYLEYFRASKSALATVLILCAFVVTQGIVNGSEYWLAFWTRKEEEHFGTDDTEKKSFNRDFHMFLYIGLISGATILITANAVVFHKYCMRISVNLHNNMFRNVVRAPTKFFDFNPSGRVMNRFTKDLGIVDEKLPDTLFDTIRAVFEIIGVVTIVCISNYLILVPTVFIILALITTRHFYVGPVRAIKRAEALSRSPMFTHLTASLQGLSTIRSSNSQPILRNQFESFMNTNSSSWYLYLSTLRWFATWLELTCVIYLVTITFSFFLLPPASVGENIGLAISSALVLNLSLQWGMRQSAECENNMISVERVVEYSRIETEAPLESSPGKEPPEDWPIEGGIVFDTVSLSYGDESNTKDVLKKLTFDIQPREKIGIVGRTGAGKSSIIAALFRMEEPRGSIFIDNVCINEIGLHDLRRNISIIPQDPVLFSGTARYNLDPFDKYQDSEIWRALEEVHMKEAIPALDFTITDGGSNLSVGQRQLICLARAILRKNRIILMDEATANVDLRTDELIQRTIRTNFAHCTIITIAHRLHSVMDCDRILVLDNGCLMEYDHPYVLLNNPAGALASMVRQVGQSGREILHNIAAKTYFAIHPKNSNADDNEDDLC